MTVLVLVLELVLLSLQAMMMMLLLLHLPTARLPLLGRQLACRAQGELTSSRGLVYPVLNLEVIGTPSRTIPETSSTRLQYWAHG